MIWVYDKLQLRAHPSKIENTGGQTYFYSVDGPDGTLDHQVEEHFAGVEDRAAAPYRRLMNGQELSGQERADFSTFLATLYLRSPGMIRSAAEANGKFLQVFMGHVWRDRKALDRSIDEMVEAGALSADVDRDGLWKFWNDRDGYTINVLEKSGLFAIGAADGIQERLFDMNWYLLDSAGPDFITGDQAVTMWAPPRPPMVPSAFADPEVEVSFALTPRTCLLLTPRWLGSFRRSVPDFVVRQMNELRAHRSDRFLWSASRDDEVMNLAMKHQGTRQTISVSGEGHIAPVEVRRRLK